MDSGYRSMFTGFEDVVNRPPPYQWTESAAIECCLYAGTESIRIRFQTAY